jgi:hypothetical protein
MHSDRVMNRARGPADTVRGRVAGGNGTDVRKELARLATIHPIAVFCSLRTESTVPLSAQAAAPPESSPEHLAGREPLDMRPRCRHRPTGLDS